MASLMTFHWILERVICNHHDYHTIIAGFRLSPVKEKYTMSIIANKIIMIIAIIE